MDETTQLGLSLLQPAQAQKHVTMNEALMRIDALTQLVLQSRLTATPPAVVADGTAYGVPTGAVDAWAGKDGTVAFGSNGGWSFVAPKRGWRAFFLDEGMSGVHDGANWQRGMATLSQHGAGLRAGLAEIEHIIGAGTTSATAIIIPSHVMVLGVTARVIAEITGTLTGWQLGNVGAPDRFGTGLGLSLGSWAKGILSAPQTYYTPSSLELSATGGNFADGAVRIAVHYLELTLPQA